MMHAQFRLVCAVVLGMMVPGMCGLTEAKAAVDPIPPPRPAAPYCLILEGTRNVGGPTVPFTTYQAKVEYKPSANKKADKIILTLQRFDGMGSDGKPMYTEIKRTEYKRSQNQVTAEGGTSWYSIETANKTTVYLLKAFLVEDDGTVTPSDYVTPLNVINN